MQQKNDQPHFTQHIPNAIKRILIVVIMLITAAIPSTEWAKLIGTSGVTRLIPLGTTLPIDHLLLLYTSMK